MFWIASTAIIVPLVCLVFLRMNALKGMSISLLSVLGAAYYWKMSITVIGASMIQGVFKAFAIIFILFGATVLLQTLEKTGAIRWVEKSFTAISTDLNILLILIAFLFGSLIEGVAGFGTPAIIAAPILIAVGFSPFAAVVLTLMANKAAVPFGAVGVPTFIGFSNIKQANWGAFQEISQVLSILDFLNIAITPLLLIIFYHVLFTKQYAMIKRYVVFSLMIG
ncbi:MAG TPA: L-lactate permease, partial [Savagea sp.]